MSHGLAALLGCTFLLADPGGQKLLLQERRESVVMLLLTPNRTALRGSISTFLEAARAELSNNTSLELVSAEQAGVDLAATLACPYDRRLSCWVAHGKPPDRPQTRYLFVLTVQPLDAERERLTAVLIDLFAAMEISKRVEGSDRDEQIEERIFELALQPEPQALSAADPEQIQRYFADLFGSSFRDRLESSGHWQPYGSLMVSGLFAGTAVELDGRPLGTTKNDQGLELEGLLPGSRRLAVQKDTWSEVTNFTIARGTMSTAVFAPPAEAGDAPRVAMAVSGAALSAAGLAFLSVALVQALDPGTGVCLVHAGEEGNCPAVGNFTLAYRGSSGSPTHDPAVQNPPGISTAPFGASLMVAGATIGLWSWFFAEENQVPWWSVAAGLGAGALIYGLSAALDVR